MYRKIEGGKIELDQAQCNTTATEEAKQGSEAKPDRDRKDHLSKLFVYRGVVVCTRAHVAMNMFSYKGDYPAG